MTERIKTLLGHSHLLSFATDIDLFGGHFSASEDDTHERKARAMACEALAGVLFERPQLFTVQAHQKNFAERTYTFNLVVMHPLTLYKIKRELEPDDAKPH